MNNYVAILDHPTLAANARVVIQAFDESEAEALARQIADRLGLAVVEVVKGTVA